MGQQILTKVVLSIVNEKAAAGRYGVSLLSLPPFDYSALAEGVCEGRQAEIFMLGFDPVEQRELLSNISDTERVKYYFTVEEAEKSRNTGNEEIFRILVVRRQELEKLSSLRWFDEVDLDLVYKRSCNYAKEKLEHSNTFIRSLILAIGRQDMRILLNFERVIEYLDLLMQAESTDLPSVVKDKLYKLGLCADAKIDIGTVSIEAIKSRLKQNRACVVRLSSLDQAERKSINNYYANNPESKIARKILKYYNTKDIELLSDMQLDEVEQALKSVARKASETNSSKRRGSAAKPTALAAQLIFDDKMDSIAEVLENIQQELGNRSDPDSRSDPDKPTRVEIPVNGTRLVFTSTPTTERIADELVDTLAFGGVIFADVLNPKEAIEALDKYEYKSFDESYLNETMERLERAHSYIKDETASIRIAQFIEARKQIVSFSMRLQDAPMLQVIKEQPLFSAYLSSYERLLSSVNDDFPKIWRDSPAIAKEMVNTIISLDMLYIVGRNEFHAMPTPLNPLYLWKYIRLAEEILDSRGADALDADKLSEEDKEFIMRKADDIPDPQTVVLMPNTLSEDAGARFLPLVGRLGCIPVYSTRQQISNAASGEDTLRQSIIRYLCLYPHAGMMLRLCFINPPSVELLITMLKRLNSDKEFNIQGIDLSIYRTKEAAPDWVEIQDSSLNDGLLGRVKTKGDLQFHITVENKTLTYSQILNRINREQHIIIVFDPNEKRIDVAQSNRQMHIHPLCVPQIYTFDRYSQEVDIRPSNEGGIFSDYTSIIQKLNEQASSFRSTSVFFNTPLKKDTYKSLLEKADWLIMLDQNLRSWDISLRSASEKLFYSERDYRSVGIYSSNTRKFISGYSRLIEDMGNFLPCDKGVNKVIDAIRSTNDDGLLSIVSHSSNSIFDRNHGKGSIGLALAAISYMRCFPNAILVGMDTQLAREWLSERNEGMLPDLVGIRLGIEGTADIDLIEVKTYEDYQINGNIISGHAVEQVTVLERLIKEMLSSSERITTVARREILREQVFEGLFNLKWDAAKKHKAVQALNDLFAGEIEATINKTICSIVFEQPNSSTAEYQGDGIYEGQSYTLRIIGAEEVQDILADKKASEVDCLNWVIEASASNDSQQASDDSCQERMDEEPTQIESRLHGEISRNLSTEIGEQAKTSVTPDVAKSASSIQQQMDDRITKEQCLKLNKVLRDFGIKALPIESSQVQQASRFIRFKVQLNAGETIRNLSRYKADIGREMEAHGEILIDNIGGTRFVGIDIPLEQVDNTLNILDYTPLLDSNEGNLNILAGQLPDGQVKLIDIAKAPHLLVAGATNSGKTIFLYSLLVSLLYQYSSDDLNLLIVDPKQTDFAFFNRLPHLLGARVITSPEEALGAIDDINRNEKEQRTQRLLSPNVHRDIESYNRSNPDNKMKRLVIVIDEYADLVQAAEIQGIRKDFESRLCMLAARVRNLGIHFVIATQRPSATIVTGPLKANLPFRISFRLPAHQDSMTILDRSGAENLLGKGDMLMVTESEVLRMQGFYISEPELAQFIEQRL